MAKINLYCFWRTSALPSLSFTRTCAHTHGARKRLHTHTRCSKELAHRNTHTHSHVNKNFSPSSLNLPLSTYLFFSSTDKPLKSITVFYLKVSPTSSEKDIEPKAANSSHHPRTQSLSSSFSLPLRCFIFILLAAKNRPFSWLKAHSGSSL